MEKKRKGQKVGTQRMSNKLPGPLHRLLNKLNFMSSENAEGLSDHTAVPAFLFLSGRCQLTTRSLHEFTPKLLSTSLP